VAFVSSALSVSSFLPRVVQCTLLSSRLIERLAAYRTSASSNSCSFKLPELVMKCSYMSELYLVKHFHGTKLVLKGQSYKFSRKAAWLEKEEKKR
jgi:hypothetical protein